MNDVILSDDHKSMTIISEDGQRRCDLTSARTDGFTWEHVRYATHDFQFSTVPGTHTARTKRWFGREVTVHTSVGPPTWRLPRMRIGRDHVMVGWLRGMAAVHW